MAGLDFDQILSNFGANFKGALEERQRGQRDSIAMSRGALDAYRESLNSSRGDPTMMAFFGALGRPTRTGSGGEALSGAFEEYAGALERAESRNMTRADKLAAIIQAQAKLREQEAGLPFQSLSDTLAAGKSASEIQQLAAEANYLRGMGGITNAAGTSPTLAQAAQGRAPLEAAANQAAQVGMIPGSVAPPSMLPPSSFSGAGASPFDPRPTMSPSPPAPAPSGVPSTTQPASPNTVRMAQLRAQIAHAQQFGGVKRAKEDVERWTKELEQLPEFIAEKELAKKGLIPQNGAFTPLPGSPAEKEAADARTKEREDEEKKRIAAESKEARSDLVLNTLDKIDRLSKDKTAWLPVAGPAGYAASLVPGTNAATVAAHLETLKGTAITQVLQSLKEASTTGASGMGNLTEREGERLAASLGAISQSMTKEEFNAALQDFRKTYMSVVHGKTGAETFNRGRGLSESGRGQVEDPYIAEARKRGLIK